jgi:hypothetical protein
VSSAEKLLGGLRIQITELYLAGRNRSTRAPRPASYRTTTLTSPALVLP